MDRFQKIKLKNALDILYFQMDSTKYFFSS